MDDEAQHRSTRRAFVRALTAVPAAFVLTRSLSGCASDPPIDAPDDATISEGGQDGPADNGADASPEDAGEDAATDAGEDAAMDAEDAAVECHPTTHDAEGPFFESGTPMRTVIAPSGEPGDRLRITGRLTRADDCTTPLVGFVLDIWQADASGNYPPAMTTDHKLRGRLVTGDDGHFAFETIRPGHYSTTDGPRPEHIHVKVYTPEGAQLLVTQIYFEGDPYLGDNDSCLPPTCFSDDPARIVRLRPAMVSGRTGLTADVPLQV